MEVLKQVEEALEPFASFAAYLEAHPRVGIGDVLYGWDNADEASLRQSYLRAAAAALAALRGLGWKPIEEMERLETYEVVCGAYTITGEWVMTRFQTANAAIGLGYTHFFRPLLPAPPKREVE